MILSDTEIEKAIASGAIGIEPTPDFAVALGSCSIDLRLGSSFRVFNYSKISMIDTGGTRPPADITTEITVMKDEPFILHPGDFVLATTFEKVRIPSTLVGRLEGRSSLGRLGIVVHSTASVVDPGFEGVIVMELGNLGRVPVALYSGMRACALTFETLSSPSKRPYSLKPDAKYANQSAPVASRIDEDTK